MVRDYTRLKEKYQKFSRYEMDKLIIDTPDEELDYLFEKVGKLKLPLPPLPQIKCLSDSIREVLRKYKI